MNLAERLKAFTAQNEMNHTVEDSGNHVLFIDGMNTFIRAFAATPTMDDDGQHVGGITGFLLSIGAAIRQFRPSRVVIAFDGAGGSQRRRAMFPDYKGNRRSMTRLNRTYEWASIEQEKESQRWQLVKLITILRNLPVTILAPENVEADDVIAYLAQLVEERDGRATILSTDKDFLQLVSEKISVWNPVKKKLYVPALVVEDYGFHPHNFLLYRAITGDTSDHIPGVEGIKEKTLLKHFSALAQAEKMTVEQLFEIAKTTVAATKKPPVVLTKLVESKPIVQRNVSLMRLDEVSMGGSTKIEMLRKFDGPISKLNKYELTRMLTMDKLISAFGRWDDWVLNTFAHLNLKATNGE
jgi:5'-3' exonuclease